MTLAGRDGGDAAAEVDGGAAAARAGAKRPRAAAARRRLPPRAACSSTTRAATRPSAISRRWRSRSSSASSRSRARPTNVGHPDADGRRAARPGRQPPSARRGQLGRAAHPDPHASSMGKVFMAFGAAQPPTDGSRGSGRTRSRASPTCSAELEEVRRLGYATTWDELEAGLCSTAAARSRLPRHGDRGDLGLRADGAHVARAARRAGASRRRRRRRRSRTTFA